MSEDLQISSVSQPVECDPPDEVLQACVNYVTVRWNRLPQGRVRERFKVDLIGMILGSLGVDAPEKFHPIKTPEHWGGRSRKRVA
jgi:hypothetical protein